MQVMAERPGNSHPWFYRKRDCAHHIKVGSYLENQQTLT
jgi:hypothetical protein